MTLARFTHLALPLTVLLAGLPHAANAADKVLSDQILPKDTYLYMSLPNITELKQQWNDSSMGQLWHDEEMADFKAEVFNAFDSEIQEGLAQVQEALGVTAEELMAIPSGEMSLAFSGTGNRMGAVLILDYGSSEDVIQGLLDRAVAALSAQRRLSQSDTEFDGTPITMFNVQWDGRAPTPLATEFGWFLKDERLVASNSKALLETVLTNWNGDASDSLTSNEIYSYMLSRCLPSGNSAMSKFYFDPVGLFTKLVQTGSLGEAGMGAGMAMGFLPTLGLTQLKGLGGVSTTGDSDFEWVSRSIIFADQPPMGLMRLFMLDHASQTPPEWVKQDATAYLALNWKVGDAYDAVESLVDMFQGAGALAGMVDQLSRSGPGIHIKNDIIDQLSGELQFVTAPRASDDFGTDQMLFAIGVRDEGKMSDLLTRVTDEPGFPGTKREFRGFTLYEIATPDGGGVGFTVAHGRLLIGIGEALLDQVLRNDSDVRPLSETDEFKKVASHFPSDAVAVTFSRPAEQYRSLYNALKSGQGGHYFPGMDEIFERIDFTTLPDFDVVSKYIQPTGGYWVGDENGVYMEGFSLKR
ncbi:MAG: hypothetical protein R3C19_23600 [Planctomycetaceae bacterium]